MSELTTPRRGRGDEGAVIVEFALVAPLLILLVFGLIDYGRMTNEKNVLIRGVQSAARTGAAQGTDRFADYNVLQSIQASLSTLDGSEVERVVVYKATASNGTVPAACLSVNVPADDTSAKGVSGVCNVYSPAQIASRTGILSRFPAGNCSGGWDVSWCPGTSRSRGTDTTDPDYLGVYVRVNTTSLTGVVAPISSTMSSNAVFRLDPCITGVSCV